MRHCAVAREVDRHEGERRIRPLAIDVHGQLVILGVAAVGEGEAGGADAMRSRSERESRVLNTYF